MGAGPPCSAEPRARGMAAATPGRRGQRSPRGGQITHGHITRSVCPRQRSPRIPREEEETRRLPRAEPGPCPHHDRAPCSWDTGAHAAPPRQPPAPSLLMFFQPEALSHAVTSYRDHSASSSGLPTLPVARPPEEQTLQAATPPAARGRHLSGLNGGQKPPKASPRARRMRRAGGHPHSAGSEAAAGLGVWAAPRAGAPNSHPSSPGKGLGTSPALPQHLSGAGKGIQPPILTPFRLGLIACVKTSSFRLISPKASTRRLPGQNHVFLPKTITLPQPQPIPAARHWEDHVPAPTSPPLPSAQIGLQTHPSLCAPLAPSLRGVLENLGVLGDQPRGFSASQGQSQQAGGAAMRLLQEDPHTSLSYPKRTGTPEPPRQPIPGLGHTKGIRPGSDPPLPQHNSRPLPRLLSLITRDKSPAPSSLLLGGCGGR